MADVFFLGTAPKTPYKYTAVLTGSPTIGGNATATVNSKTVTYVVVTGDTITSVIANLKAALVAVSVPGEFKQFSYNIPTAGTLVATGPDDGAPVTMVITVDGATITSTTVANSSPHDITNILNWSTGALPAGGDYGVADADVAWKYNMNGFAATAVKFRRTANHNSDIGLPDVNPLGFAEYRPTKLSQLGLVVDIYDSGTGVVRLTAVGAISVSIAVRGPDAQSSGREPTVQLYGTSATWVPTVNGGSLSIYEGSTITTWTAARASLRCPNLRTAATVNFSSVYAEVALTVGTLAVINANSLVTFLAGSSFGPTKPLSIVGSTVFWASAAALDVTTIGLNSVLNCTQAPSAFVVGAITIAKGAKINDPYKRLTKPYAVTLDQCAPGDITLDLGDNPTITVS